LVGWLDGLFVFLNFLLNPFLKKKKKKKKSTLGPPENTREHVMQATKCLVKGEWERSIHLIESIKVWDLMPDVDSIKKMLSTFVSFSVQKKKKKKKIWEKEEIPVLTINNK